MAHRFSIEGEPKGTYGKVLAALKEHATNFDYEKPVFTFEAEGEGLAALVELGFAAAEPAPEAEEKVFNWVAYDVNGKEVYKAQRNDGLTTEAAQSVTARAEAQRALSRVCAFDAGGNVVGQWAVKH